MFQTAYLFPGTIRDNLRYARDEIDETRMRQLLRRSAVPESMLDSPVNTLSGGEAQRVALARMLATDPVAVLLDEPTSALDPTATSVIERTVKRLAVEDGLCVIMVTHHPEQALRLDGEALLLVAGRLVESGSAEQLINNPKTEEARRFKDKELL